MKRTTLFMDEAQARELDALAQRERRPKASLVREAIAEYLAHKGRRRELPRFIGAGGSGRPDGAETHERELFANLEPHGRGGETPGAEPAPGRKGPT